MDKISSFEEWLLNEQAIADEREVKQNNRQLAKTQNRARITTVKEIKESAKGQDPDTKKQVKQLAKGVKQQLKAQPKPETTIPRSTN